MSASAATGARSRPIPFVRRRPVQQAAALALLGLLFGLFLTFVFFHEQDRQPARPITGPGIGESFIVADVHGEDMLRITVTGGERQNSLRAGGNVDKDFITLFVTYEALATTTLSRDSTAWTARANGEEEDGMVDVFLALPAGEAVPTQVRFFGLPRGEPVTIVHKDTFADAPEFTMVVAP